MSDDDLLNCFLDLDNSDEKHHARESFIRAPFGWPGGKWHSLQHIISELGRGRVLVDGCGGSGVITINAPPSYRLKVLNDRHLGVVAFFRCLRDSAKLTRIIEWINNCPHSREDFIWCRDSWQDCSDDVERAARWYYMIKVSFSQLGRNFGRCLKGPNSLAKKLENCLPLLQEIHGRIIGQHVQVENMDVIQCIRDYDSADTDHYIDPDYIGTDPAIYEHRVEHNKLLDTVFECKGQVLVSGYETELYNARPWDRIKKWDVMVASLPQAYNKENHLDDKKFVMTRDKKATEVLYIKDAHG